VVAEDVARQERLGGFLLAERGGSAAGGSRWAELYRYPFTFSQRNPREGRARRQIAPWIDWKALWPVSCSAC
jgi:hypothetical protein